MLILLRLAGITVHLSNFLQFFVSDIHSSAWSFQIFELNLLDCALKLTHDTNFVVTLPVRLSRVFRSEAIDGTSLNGIAGRRFFNGLVVLGK